MGLPTYPAASLSPQDDQIEQERASQHLAGGCCALAAIYLMGKFYVANAGDSRYRAAFTFCSVPGDTPAEWGGARGVAGEEHPAPALSRRESFPLGRIVPVPWGQYTLL